MIKQSALVLGLTLFLIAPASAAEKAAINPSSRISATVQTLVGRTLTVKTDKGKGLSVDLPEDVHITRRLPASLDDVAAGQFIGCTAVERVDGKLYAQEIHIIPEAMRGSGEGHYPWGDEPNTTMTNGNVKALEGVAQGKSIHVTYKGGERTIEIPPYVMVTRIEEVGVDALNPGVQVSLFLKDDVKTAAVARYVTIEGAVSPK